MVETNDWLPIGSVVHVEGRDGLVMTIACMVADADTGVLWDYAAVPYPQGVTGPRGDVLLNRESIDGVFHVGFQNADEERLQDLLKRAQLSFDEQKRASRAARQMA